MKNFIKITPHFLMHSNAGLQVARGIKSGRKLKLDASNQKTAQTMYNARNHTVK